MSRMLAHNLGSYESNGYIHSVVFIVLGFFIVALGFLLLAIGVVTIF